jgi:hypothetical protein
MIDLINQATSLFLPNLPTSAPVSAPPILPMSTGLTNLCPPLISVLSMASQGLASAHGMMSAPISNSMSSLTSVMVIICSPTDGPLQNAYPPAHPDASSSGALSRQAESLSPTLSTPLSLQTAQQCHEAKHPSALPPTPKIFSPPHQDSSSSSGDTRVGGAEDVGIQHALLQDATLQWDISILPSTSVLSPNHFAYTTPE